MFKLLVFLLICVVAVWPSPREAPWYDLGNAEQLFDEFVMTYEKQYQDEEERQKRFQIFKDNLQLINQYNLESKTATFGITRFADMTTEDYEPPSFANMKPVDPLKCDHVSTVSNDPVPDSFDWREHNIVTKVKSIGDNYECYGAHWAFSAVDNMEAQYAKKHKELKYLSTQQLLDCVKDNRGCMFGNPVNAFAWVRDFGGIELDANYPYIKKAGMCRFKKSDAVANVSYCKTFDGSTEDDLKKHLVSTGPLVITLKPRVPINFYKGGILDHCTTIPNYEKYICLLVGYGKENGTPFWTVKTSFGEKYGENGYFRIKMYENCLNITGLISTAIVE